jgi:hypothetical protein
MPKQKQTEMTYSVFIEEGEIYHLFPSLGSVDSAPTRDLTSMSCSTLISWGS